jgi:hypothetical protein
MRKSKEGSNKRGDMKDWMPGEYKIELTVVSPGGRVLTYYLPHLTKEVGEQFLDLASKSLDLPVGLRKWPTDL